MNQSWRKLSIAFVIGLFISASSWGIPKNAEAAFEDVTATTLGTFWPDQVRGAAWGDYDGDGFEDLVTSVYVTFNPKILLFRNQGDGSFNNVSSDIGLESSIRDAYLIPLQVNWADFDNDGKLDFYVSTWGTPANVCKQDLLFKNVSNQFIELANSSGIIETTEVICRARMEWMDVNRDGFLDIYLASMSHQGDDRLYLGNASRMFTDQTTSFGISDSLGGTGAAWGDYNGDGNPDFYKLGRLYRGTVHNGQANLSDVTSSVAPAMGSICGQDYANWVDYDGDGDLDIFVICDTGYKMYRNDGGHFNSEVAEAIGLSGLNRNGLAGAAWADFDNDGDMDVALSKANMYPYSPENIVYRNEGDGTFVDVTQAVGLQRNSYTQGVTAWADYDKDGDLDLFIGNKLYRNNLFETGRHWLQIQLQGRLSNYDAIGTRVEIHAGGRTQIREVEGLSGNGRIVHFGLDDANLAEQVIIRWSSGYTSMLQNIPVDQRITVTEESVRPTPPTVTINFPAVGNTLILEPGGVIAVRGVVDAAANTSIDTITLEVWDAVNNQLLSSTPVTPYDPAATTQIYWYASFPQSVGAGLNRRLVVKATSFPSSEVPGQASVGIKPNGEVITCWVLSAAYGSPKAWPIQTLRQFRETHLFPNHPAHQRFLRWYDLQGPRIAAFLDGKPWLKACIRAIFTSLAHIARLWL